MSGSRMMKMGREKAMRKHKKIWKLLPVLAAAFCIQVPVLAADGTLTVQLNYEDSLEFKKGDYFTVTCQSGAGENRELEIDCDKVPDSGLELSVPEGDYQVTDITYSGGNGDVEQMGYGVTSQFSVAAGEAYQEIRISVGKRETEKLDMMYDSVMMKQNGALTGELADWQDTGSETGETGETEEIPETEVPEETDPAEEPAGDVVDPAETETDRETPEEETPKQETNNLIKAVPLLVLAAAGFGVIFVLHKKGKF